MKTAIKYLFIVLLTMPQTMYGQSYEGAISKAFENVLNNKGITHSTIRDEYRDKDGNLEETTVIYNIAVGRVNFKVFDELKNAFQTNGEHKTSVYTCFGPIEDSYRQQLTVKRKHGGDFRVGQKDGSSYAIATFEDSQREGYRMVFAAEWWDTDDKDIRKGVLLYSYGEKPAMHNYTAQVDWGDKLKAMSGSVDWEELRQSLGDAASGMRLPALVRADSLMRFYFPDRKADFTTDPKGWMRQAMNDVEALDDTEWMRLFGMLTQMMQDRADRESSEDMVVAAGILLGMSKHAIGLGREEKDICAARLKELATLLQSRSQYVHDLLMLAAKKLKDSK